MGGPSPESIAMMWQCLKEQVNDGMLAQGIIDKKTHKFLMKLAHKSRQRPENK